LPSTISGTAAPPGGHWLLNGAALPNSQDNFVAASQLSQVTYQGGAGTETIWVRASDGIQYGAWKFINATDTAPVLTPNNVNITVSHSNLVAASTLFTASDQDGDGIAQYDFWNSGTARRSLAAQRPGIADWPGQLRQCGDALAGDLPRRPLTLGSLKTGGVIGL
jgi:hypothetical protein